MKSPSELFTCCITIDGLKRVGMASRPIVCNAKVCCATVTMPQL